MVDNNKKKSKSASSYKTSFCRKCITLFISGVLLILLPLLVSQTLFNLALRKFVRFLAKVFQPRFRKMLNPLGHSFTIENIYKNPRSSTVFQSVFDGNLTIEQCKRIFQENVLEAKTSSGQLIYPEMKQCLVQWCGYYFWKDCADFDMSNHFTVYETSPLTDSQINTDEDINAIWTNLINKPFKRNTPLWEVVIVQNYFSDRTNPETKQTAFIILFHHALGDGYSWFKLIRSNLFYSIEQPVIPRLSQKQNGSGIIHRLLEKVMHPLGVLYAAANFLCLPFTNSIISNTNRDGKMNSNFTGTIPLKALKQTAKDCEVSLTSVLLGGFTLALREFFVKRDGSDKHLQSEAVVTPYPISNHKETGLTNQMTLNMLYLPLQSASHLEVLKLCHSQYEENRKHYPSMGVSGQNVLLTGPGISRKVLFANRSFPLTFTNFFLGSNPMYFDRSKVNRCTHISFNVGCGQGVGAIGLRAISFEDRIRLAVAVDSSVMNAHEATVFTKSIEKHLHDIISLNV